MIFFFSRGKELGARGNATYAKQSKLLTNKEPTNGYADMRWNHKEIPNHDQEERIRIKTENEEGGKKRGNPTGRELVMITTRVG